MVDTMLTPEPEDRNPKPLPATEKVRSELGFAGMHRSVAVIGQDAALDSLSGVVLRYLHTRCEESACSRGNTALVGPIGCGKTASVEAIGREYGLTVAKLDLAEGTPQNIHMLATRAIRKQETCLDQGGILLVENLMCAASETRQALGRILSNPGTHHYAISGTKQEMDLSAFLWITEFSGLALPTHEGVLTPYELPLDLAQSLDFVIPFRSLTKSDLFAVLSISESSPLTRITNELATHGVTLELSELAIWELVEQAVTEYPNSGARGLHRVVRDLELRVWTSLATASGEPLDEETDNTN